MSCISTHDNDSRGEETDEKVRRVPAAQGEKQLCGEGLEGSINANDWAKGQKEGQVEVSTDPEAADGNHMVQTTSKPLGSTADGNWTRTTVIPNIEFHPRKAMMMLIMSHLHPLLLLQRQPPHLPHGHQQLPPPLSQRKQNPLDVLLLPFLSHALPHRILTHLKKHDTKKGKHHTNRQILRSVVEVGLPLQE
ncbi:unnamed protein product [Boreogadus saida]